ncbi:MAG: hypothetical protein U5K54_17760 [Cytophagales bacterium]|nr:hypothetical protein [Cytophagales bacterium]
MYTLWPVRYISRLNVEWAEEGSGVIDLSINGTNPKKEIDFLAGLIASYGQLDLDKKNETGQRTIAFIRSQLLGIKDSLRTVEFQLERFGNSNRVQDMSADAQRLFTRVEALEIQKSELLIRENYIPISIAISIKTNPASIRLFYLPRWV